MNDVILSIIKSLVDNPENVKVHEVQGLSNLHLEISVDSNDIGKIVGKHGRMISSIRNIAYAIASKNKKRITLEIVE